MSITHRYLNDIRTKNSREFFISVCGLRGKYILLKHLVVFQFKHYRASHVRFQCDDDL